MPGTIKCLGHEGENRRSPSPIVALSMMEMAEILERHT